MRQRLRFVTLMGAGIVALAGLTVLMSGCGSGASTAQSTVQGSYGGVWRAEGAPGTESGALSFTVDSHGKFVGSFTENGVTSLVNGSMQNDGTFTGEVSRETAGTTVSYSVSGQYSPQQVDENVIASQDATYGAGPTPTTAPNPTSDTFKAGLAANFRETINGVEYAGTFQVVGGTSTTGA